MRKTGNIVAVVCSDIHLSLNPPAARAMEPNWLNAMARSLAELQEVAYKFEVPILCAGDIFHYWKAEPELINFAIDKLPKMYAIPGQHDLPLHNLDDIKKSAYWTLSETHKLRHRTEPLTFASGLKVFLFPWGCELQPNTEKTGLNIALIHKYVWYGDAKYATAPDSARLGKLQKILATYDACIFGDNHKGFCTSIGKGKTSIFNCGGFMRRASDEIHYRPTIGLLHDTGLIEPHYLDLSKEKMERATKAPMIQDNENVRNFVRSLGVLEDEQLDFEKALRIYLETNEINNDVQTFAIGALENEC